MKTRNTIIGTSVAAFMLLAAMAPAASAFSLSNLFHKNKTAIEQSGSGSGLWGEFGKRDYREEKHERKNLGEMGQMMPGMAPGMMMGGSLQMSAETKKLMDDLRAAREAGDSTKVTALRTQLSTQRETEMKAQQAALDAAIAGGYEAWKAYTTAQKMPTAMIQKITPENFATFAEMHATQKKMQELQQKLGMPMPGMGGMMKGGKGGMGMIRNGSGSTAK